MERRKPNFDWDVNVMPRWRNLPHGSQLIVESYAIPKAAKNPDAAFRFIEWLSSRELSTAMSQAGSSQSGLVPDRVIMARNLSTVADLAPRLGAVFMWTAEHGFQLPRPSWYIGDQNYWSLDNIGRALSGQMSVASALELTENHFNALVRAGASWMHKPEMP